MKVLIPIAVILLFTSCAEKDQQLIQKPIPKSIVFKQDIQMCGEQPFLVVCQSTCKTDPTYEWCHAK